MFMLGGGSGINDDPDYFLGNQLYGDITYAYICS